MSSYLGSANAREGRVRPVRRSEAADPRRRMPVGTKRRLMLPWSEVCLHMGLHDQVREVELLPDGMARISLDHGYTLVTAGEAGIYHDRKIGYYTY